MAGRRTMNILKVSNCTITCWRLLWASRILNSMDQNTWKLLWHVYRGLAFRGCELLRAHRDSTGHFHKGRRSPRILTPGAKHFKTYVQTCTTEPDAISEIKTRANEHDQIVLNLTGPFITRWQILSSSPHTHHTDTHTFNSFVRLSAVRAYI